MVQKLGSLSKNLALAPQNIHEELCKEIDAWEQSRIQENLPVVADIGKLSELIIAEGNEDARDRPQIEIFYAGSMRYLVENLASLRKLLLGEAFLTDKQKHEIKALKSTIKKQKEALQSFFQTIAG